MLDSRFWDKVDKTGNCWEWIAGLNPNGYGQFRLNGKHKLAHRLSYEDKYGKIPEGLELDHLCRNRKCVSPDHLDPVTHLENVRRGLAGKINHYNSKKTHCPQGHEYSEENTYNHPRGNRNCKICHRIGERYKHVQKYAKVLLNAECD